MNGPALDVPTVHGVRCALCPARLRVEVPAEVESAGWGAPFLRGFVTGCGWTWGAGDRADLITCGADHPAATDSYVEDLRGAVAELARAYAVLKDKYGDQVLQVRDPNGRYLAVDALASLVQAYLAGFAGVNG